MSVTEFEISAGRRTVPAPRSGRRATGVVLGVFVVAAVAASIILTAGPAGTLAVAFAGLLAAASAFLLGRGADGGRPQRWAVSGAAVAAAGAILHLTTGLSALALLLSAAGAFGLAAACALLVAGIPRAREPWTPRYLLPVPLALSVRRRRPMRLAITAAVLSGALIALRPAIAAMAGEPLGAIAAGVGAASLLVIMCASVRLARPLQEAETAAAVLAAGCLAVFGIGVVTAVGLVLFPAPVAALIAVAVTAGAVGVAVPRGTRAARLADPGRPAYRTAVSGYELNNRLRPQTAGVARSVSDVVALIEDARQRGLTVRTHSTGHRSSMVPPMSGEALIRVLLDEPVTVDPLTSTARVPAGAKWADVLEAVVPHGLGAPHGSSGDVGVIGYLLRGGLSFYGRGRGVAANCVERIELVDAEGVLRIVDAASDPDLFWALRGGGGGFGIVTALTIRLFPLTEIATGTIMFGLDRAQEVARAWYEWTLDAPAEISTALRIVEVPKMPGMPRHLAGRTCIVIDGVAHRLGDHTLDPWTAARTLLDAVRAVDEPLLDSWRLAAPHEAPHTHMDLPFGLHHAADHLMVRDLGPQGIAAFVDAATRSGIMCELRQLGGALAHEPTDAGAVGLYAGAFAYFAGRLGPSDDAARGILDRLRDTLSPWDTGLVVPTFAADPSRPQRLFDDDTSLRVRAIRQHVDPAGVFAGDVVPDA
ncbi:FAD-binding oxidoreductase [Microbacterium timonense]|uniref:FAD-binding oxidoreductase n=1 Tax=Microbacterium timonense TaxID=2086576 RepID=UPI000D10EEF4|nr:FAD-binding protein [Microbacterium timonense]